MLAPDQFNFIHLSWEGYLKHDVVKISCIISCIIILYVLTPDPMRVINLFLFTSPVPFKFINALCSERDLYSPQFQTTNVAPINEPFNCHFRSQIVLTNSRKVTLVSAFCRIAIHTSFCIQLETSVIVSD